MTFLPGPPPATGPGTVERLLGELHRALGWRRRVLSAGLLAGAMALALQVLEPAPPATVPVLVAAHDVRAGATLRSGDLRLTRRPAATLPAGALSLVASATGRPVATAVRRGEVLTDVRLAGAGALRGLAAGTVAAPVRVADPATADLVRPGDTVDVLAAGAGDADGGYARLAASAVPVLSVLRTSASDATGEPGVLLVVATTSVTAQRLAAAAVTDRLSVVLRRPAYRSTE